MSTYTVRAVSHRDGTHTLYERAIEASNGDAAYVTAYEDAPHLLGSTEESRRLLVTVEIERS